MYPYSDAVSKQNLIFLPQSALLFYQKGAFYKSIIIYFLAYLCRNLIFFKYFERNVLGQPSLRSSAPAPATSGSLRLCSSTAQALRHTEPVLLPPKIMESDAALLEYVEWIEGIKKIASPKNDFQFSERDLFFINDFRLNYLSFNAFINHDSDFCQKHKTHLVFHADSRKPRFF